MTDAAKPLGGKAFGSTPHLPGSRTGPGEWTVNPGQARILTERARRGDLVFVTEKLDGSCCAVANVDGRIMPLIRAGYPAATSPREQHHRFAAWVAEREDRFRAALQPGERIVGEWLAQAHGTRYRLACPDGLFVGFAAFRGGERLSGGEMHRMVAHARLRNAWMIHAGGAFSVEDAQRRLRRYHGKSGHHGWHGAQEEPEGFVWVVERNGRFDFAAKWVRPGKTDGHLLQEVSGGAPVWNEVLAP